MYLMDADLAGADEPSLSLSVTDAPPLEALLDAVSWASSDTAALLLTIAARGGMAGMLLLPPPPPVEFGLLDAAVPDVDGVEWLCLEPVRSAWPPPPRRFSGVCIEVECGDECPWEVRLSALHGLVFSCVIRVPLG